jgi:predicted DNA-binding protein with PD1-like motif
MRQYHSGNHNVLVFEKGEQLIVALTDFCRDNRIHAGFFHGLGGALAAELGYYHLDSREYEFQKLDQVLEIASLHGNIALKDGEPFIHAHGVFSDAELRTYAGHIKELTVGGTCEVHLRTFEASWQRRFDEETGLSLMHFHE